MFDNRPERPPTGGEPHWLDALSSLFTPDPVTGWMDTDAALDAMAWLGKQVFAQSQTDRGFHNRASLQRQVEATAEITNSMAATQATRIAQFCATSVEYAVTRVAGPGRAHGSGGSDGAGALEGGTETRWIGETAHAPASELAGVPAGDGVLPGDTREVRHPIGFKADYADTDLGAGLCLGPGAASARVEDAIDAVTKTPRLLAEVGAGRFDSYRLAQVTRELVEAGEATCARVEDELLTRGVAGWTSRRVQARARTLVRRVDPAAARAIKRKRGKDAINVMTRPGAEDGTTEVQAILWSKDAVAAFAAVEDLARALHRDTTTAKTLGECRADAMVDLILNNAAVTTNVTLLAPVNTTAGAGPVACPSRLGADLEEQLAHMDWDREFIQFFDPPGSPIRVDLQPPGTSRPSSGDSRSGRHGGFGGLATAPPLRSSAYSTGPGDGLSDVEIPGIGVIPADAVQAMLHSVGASIGRALFDQDVGALIETSTRTYRPTAAIRRFVEQRDRHCRFPTCAREAKYCDADHVVPWPDGQTTPANLQLLCRHHHRAKHEGGWHVTMTPDGVCTWTSSTGRTFTTLPCLTDVITDLTITPGPGPL